MPRFIIDNCITVNAPDLEAANKYTDLFIAGFRASIARTGSPFKAIHVCHIEEVPEGAPVEGPKGLKPYLTRENVERWAS